MIVTNPVCITERELKVLARAAKGQINRIYLHWTAGYYGQPYDDYHLCVDEDGQVTVHCRELTAHKEHTWLRNRGGLAIALCCGAEAACWAPVSGCCRTARGACIDDADIPASYARVDLGAAPPTAMQIEVTAKLVALLCKELGLPICRDAVMTHCEVAFKDGYGPGGNDPDMRWDLWFLPDPEQRGKLEPGGELIRGKALFYMEEMKQRYKQEPDTVA